MANFPGSAPSIPTSVGSTTLALQAGIGHAALHNLVAGEVAAIAAKLGIGSSTPASGKVLRGLGGGASAWEQLDLTTDVTGILPTSNGGTGNANLSFPSGSETVVGRTTTETLANKTLTSPTITNFSNATHNHQTASGGGLLDPKAMADAVKLVNRQDNTTNNVVTNQLLQVGWGWVDGDGLTRLGTEAVTFPVAYESPPVVIVQAVGALTGSPDSIDDFTVSSGIFSAAVSITSTGFTARVSRVSSDGADPGVLASGSQYSYAWIAIGTKAR